MMVGPANALHAFYRRCRDLGSLVAGGAGEAPASSDFLYLGSLT